MHKICKEDCSPYSEARKRSKQLGLPQTPVEPRKRNLDEERKCDYEERRGRAEARRRKLIRKLKFEYRINVEEVNSQILEDMILQTEMMEKRKQMREVDKIRRRFNFISKLVEEEKCKRRGAGPINGYARDFVLDSKFPSSKSRPAVRKKLHKVRETSEVEADPTRIEGPDLKLYPEASGGESKDGEYEIRTLEEDAEVTRTEESESDLATCDSKFSRESFVAPEFFASPKEVPVNIPTEPKETCLKSIPDQIVFDNCEPNKKYSRTYRVSNVGFELVHCRYVGIEAEDRRAPVRVEMTDSALLRPGLSFSAKVKMFSSAEISELKCFLVYETRRKKNPDERAYFRILVKCLPVRSIVEVSPTIVRFPFVTWNVATGPERSKYLRKTVKIKNEGAKDCSCAILSAEDSKKNPKASISWVGEEFSARLTPSLDSYDGENPGEDFYVREGREEASAILSELLANVFRVFRFSRKYHIQVPAMSVVSVDLDFSPEYKGFHHEAVVIRFEGAANCSEEKLEMMGGIKKVPLRVEPSVIDLKTCTINSGVYEGTFRVYNESNGPFPVRLRVPGSMKRHSLVFPGDPVIQPTSYQTCSVRLFPRLSIANDAFRYYTEDTKVLEFPVFIQPKGQKTCEWDRIKVYVFAVLTDYALELQPPEINFGFVTTLETVRAEISLINHSMCPQEFGFLHLPMGVRIEPNYGFGVILPKETIRLHLLYSPVLTNAPREGKYCFRIQVTSVAKLGGFAESVQAPPETETADTISSEELIYNTEAEGTPQDILSSKDSEVNDGEEGEVEEEEEEDEEESLIDEAEELKILENKQQRIREYLKQRSNILSIVSNNESTSAQQNDTEGENVDLPASSSRNEAHVIICEAVVVKPFYQLSSTMVQLPATPLSSVSVTRLQINTNSAGMYNCRFRDGTRKKSVDSSFQAIFEFHTRDPITIEPQTGDIIPGKSVPFAVIFRPEFSKDELTYQSRVLKAEFLYEEAKSKGDASPPSKTKSKTKTTKPMRSRNQKPEIESQEVNLSSLELDGYDLFAGEKALQQMVDSFHRKIKVKCVIKILPCQNEPERIEYHNLILVAPIIKPSFIFLGSCHEISFGKVAVGDRSRQIIQIQNISLNRISPRITALDPSGPFTCTTGCKLDKVDPEHIWRHPITFAPTAERGKETEFFEVRHGATSITLTANGEGVEPEYAFSPDFVLCAFETSVDVITEAELCIENRCEAELRFRFVVDFVKGAFNFRFGDDSTLFETNESRKSDANFKKQDKRTNQTTKDEKKRISYKKEMIPEVDSQLETKFIDIKNLPSDLFAVTGLDANNEIVLNPLGRVSLKIKFFPNKENISNNGENFPLPSTYAVGYGIMLARRKVKHLTILGTILSEK